MISRLTKSTIIFLIKFTTSTFLKKNDFNYLKRFYFEIHLGHDFINYKIKSIS